MRSSLIKSALAVAIVVATGAIWVVFIPSSLPVLQRLGVLDLLGVPAQATDATQQPQRQAGPTRVVAAAVQSGALNNRITAIGDGRATRSVTLTADAAGKIVAVDAVSGSFVKEGAQVLALDDEVEKIAVERARIILKNAQDDVDRLSQLKGSGATTAVAVQAAQLELRTAQLGLQDAELKLTQRVVLAPISGWIGLAEVEPGDRIQAQDPITVIADRSEILIDFSVPERVINDLAIGDPVQVVSLASPDRPRPGVISAIDNIVDRASRSLRVQARVENTDDSLRPGMAFQVDLEFVGNTLPSVPPLAVQWSSQGSFVWIVREGKAVRVDAVIRQRNADSVLIEAEVEPDEMVIVEGVQSLRAGAAVEAVPETGAPLDAAAPTAGTSTENL